MRSNSDWFLGISGLYIKNKRSENDYASINPQYWDHIEKVGN